jgi:hypothetical protein
MRLWLCVLVLVLVACDPQDDKPPPEEAPAANVTSSLRAPPSAAAIVTGAPRSYLGKDLRRDPCVAVEPSGTLDGNDCKSGFLVFGPYANVAAGRDIDLSFDVEASSEVTLLAELVSGMGTIRYGSLPPQKVEKGRRRPFGLTLRAQVPIEGLEARLVGSGPGQLNFRIRDLLLQVH